MRSNRNNNHHPMRTWPFNILGTGANFAYRMVLLAVLGFFGFLLLMALLCGGLLGWNVSPWWADSNNISSEQAVTVHHYYGDLGVQNGNNGSLVNGAIGAPFSPSFVDRSEGAVNQWFNPNDLTRAAEAARVTLYADIHNGPNGLRPVLTLEGVVNENQIHAVIAVINSSAGSHIIEIAAVRPSIDKIHPNPATPSSCVGGETLWLLYNQSISPDPNKVSDFCN